MNKVIKQVLSMTLTVMMICSLCSTAFAANNPSEENNVSFSHVSLIAVGERTQRTFFDADGEEITVALERVAQYARAGGETWLVQYKKIGVTVEFYMTVSGNKVTSVYDYYISLAGSTYEDAELSKTSTYGKLTFKHVWIGGLGASTCWLKGTVTGENDEIEVTWRM